MNSAFLQNSTPGMQELDFDYPVVNIGSHPDNDVVISGRSVLPFHATVHYQNGQYVLIALGGMQAILVDGLPLARTPLTLAENQRVEIGENLLFFRRNGSPDTIRVLVTRAQEEKAAPAARASSFDGEETISVNVLSQFGEISVEQSATYELEVVNAGPIVASFAVSVRGVDADWVEISRRMLNLNEGQRAVVRITVTPPPASTSKAGKYPLQAVIFSAEYGGQQVTVPLNLVVQPYYKFMIGNLSPRDLRFFWRGRKAQTRLPITNLGNSDTEFSVTALDDENACTFDLLVNDDVQFTRQATVHIPAGETVAVPIEAAPLKQPMVALNSRRYHYTVSVQAVKQTGVLPEMTGGSLTGVPLFGWWSIVLTVALLALGIFFLVQPNIYAFDVAAKKDVIELGDTTKLEWSVSPFATRLSISNIETPINRGQSALTVAPTRSTTYEMVSGNWLSGLLQMDRRQSVTVLVVPPSPKINVFEVDQASVAKGKPVVVRWSVTKADQAFLTVEDVVYELPKDQFSGERQFILGKDALVILEARNASGSELRSYYVNVEEPNINVRTFTVWVRDRDLTATDPAGSSKVAALRTPPDPNFTEQYVELIRDSSSDTGYRVEFYLPTLELTKGEQIMLEWNIEGTDNDKVKIAPFTEELPARGLQPFFPQESMNFVLTAKSGEKEGLWMLPIKVFDGIPPQAPKIEFFRATPLKAVGPTDVQFSWSISGEWDRVEILTEGTVVSRMSVAQGFKTIRVEKSTTFILTAYNGDLSSAAPLEVAIDPSLIPIELSVTTVIPDSGRFRVGDRVAVTVAFGTLPQGKPKPTGQIFVTDGVSTCSITLPALTCDLTFKTPGDPKLITASYVGDTIYLQADSKPFPGYITVTSETVNLTPSYFFLIKPGNTQGASIPIITNQVLQLDSGLFIRVRVQPVSTVLPNDTKGKVTVSLCGQQTVNGQPSIVPGTCLFIGASTVNVVNGVGSADVVIPNFPLAGTRVLLFEYRHDDNALSPASFTQFGINVARLGIYLSLSSCTDPVAFTGCEIGVSDPANASLIFDIRRTVDNRLLSSALPAPENVAFDVFEVNLSNTRTKTWTCGVITATESGENVYKLECKANVIGQTSIRLNFDFDNVKSRNYFMGASPTVDFVRSPFNIVIKTNTVVSLNTPAFAGVKVGQIVQLSSPTGGAITLATAGGVPITATTGGFRLSASDAALLGVASGSSCGLVNGVIQVTTLSSNCAIYFTKQGSFTLEISYLGDVNYYPSASTIPGVSVARQDGIRVTWQYKELPSSPSYQAWNITSWEKSKDLPIRLLLEGPAGSFAPQSLNAKNLALTLNITKNTSPPGTCTITPIISASGTNPRTLQLAINGTGAAAVVDFTLTCSSDPMEILMGIALADSANFAFTSGQELEKGLVVATRPTVGMTLEFKRVADNDQSLVNGPPAILKTLYVGERYELKATVGVLWADAFNPPYYAGGPLSIQEAINRYLNTAVQITLPAAIQSQVNWAQSTCRSAPGANDMRIVLNSYTVINSYGYNPAGTGIHDISLSNSAPCVLVFNPGSLVPGTGTATFAFTAKDPTYPFKPDYSVTRTYQTQGLDNQTVTLTIAPALSVVGQVNDPVQNVTLTIGRQITGSTLPPFDTARTFTEQVSYSAPLGCTGLNLTGSITSATTASLSFTPPTAPCSGSFSIQYNGVNSWFKTNSVTYTLDYRDPPDTTTTLTSSSATTRFGQSVTFTATVAVVAPGTGTPTGAVQFRDNGANIGSPVPLNASGVATLSTAALQTGAHTITAVYTPATNTFKPSTSGNLAHTVQAADTTTTVVSSKNPSVLGETITLTATVAAQAPGAGTPTGTVQFRDGATNLGAAVPLNASGQAALTIAALPAGARSITAIYTPTGSNFNGSTSAAFTQNVNLVTSTSLTSNQSSTRFGEPVTFTASVSVVSPGTGTPSGSVQFRDGATNLGAPVPLDASGNAQLVWSTLPIGGRTITAVFTPSAGFVTSTSPNLGHTVNKADTTVTFSFTPAAPNGPFTFSVTVTAVAPGAGTPTGTVQLCQGGGTNCTVLGTLTLSGGSGTSATITLAAGTYNNVYARYLGDTNFNGSDAANKESFTIP